MRALAARLSELGVGPEAMVGIQLPRSVRLVVAMLAVATAGGAFLLLDPEHPVERRTGMLTTARALVRSSPHFRDGAVVEPYLPDSVDLNVSVRSWPKLSVSAVEKPLRKDASGRIYTYAEKYLGGGEGLSSAPRELPADIPGEVAERIRSLAEQVAPAALVRGAPRIDFLWRGDDIWVNEINTIPGSLSFYLWDAAGLGFAELLSEMIAQAVERHRDEAGRIRTFETNILSAQSLSGLKAAKR